MGEWARDAADRLWPQVISAEVAVDGGTAYWQLGLDEAGVTGRPAQFRGTFFATRQSLGVDMVDNGYHHA